MKEEHHLKFYILPLVPSSFQMFGFSIIQLKRSILRHVSTLRFLKENMPVRYNFIEGNLNPNILSGVTKLASWISNLKAIRNNNLN